MKKWKLKEINGGLDKMVKKQNVVEEAKSYYEKEKDNNEKIFSEMVQRVRPDIWVLMDLIDQLGIDPYILFKIIRQLHNIAIGTGYGQIVIAIEKGVARYVRGEDVDKIELPVFKKRPLDNL